MNIIKTLITSLVLGLAFQMSAQDSNKNVSPENNSREEAFIDAQKDIYIGRADKALVKLEEMYKADRTDAAVAFELVKLYATKKDLLQFEKYAKVTETYAPKNIDMLNYTTNFYLENGKYALAEAGLNKLTQISPSDKASFFKLITLYNQQGKTTEALNLLTSHEAKFGRSKETSKQKYELYLRSKQYDKMLAELSYYMGKNPTDKNILKQTASHFISINENEKAMAEYKKVLAIDPEDVEANLAILGKGLPKDKPNAYLMSLLPLITNTAMDIDPKIKELTAYIKNLANGGNQEVKTTLEDLAHKLVQAHPNEAKAYAISGDVLMLNGKTEEAILRYEKTLTLNNKVYAVWEQLMYGYLEQNRYDDLYKMANKAIDFYPNEAANFFFASLGASSKNLHKDAIDFAEEGLVVSGGNLASIVKLKTALAKAYIGQKKFDLAQTNIDEAIQKSSNKYAYAYEVFGNLYEAKSDLAKAKDAWKKSIELGNKNKDLAAKTL
jgi:Tfp pilus assembly protein PilF